MSEDEPVTTKKKLSKKAKFRIGIIAVLIVVVIVVIYFLSLLNKPAVAQLQLQSGKSTAIGPSQLNLTPKLITGKYVSYKYPVMMLPVPTQVTGQSVEDWSFSFIDVGSWFLAIDVSHAKYGKLTDDTAYTIRANNPTTYSESHQSVGGQSVDIMTDKSAPTFSEIGFVLHGNFIFSVALMGDDTSGTKPLQTTFNMVLGSLHWLSQ
jgi:hypothetical protein